MVEPQDFVQWGGVQAAMEEEQRLRIEGVRQRLRSARSSTKSGIEAEHRRPLRASRFGRCANISADATRSRRSCSAPRRAAARVRWSLTSPAMMPGKLPCPVMIIPGSLTDERLEQLS